MELSIVIPVYNRAHTIKRCLDSIWSQGLNDFDYEVICVNDCTKDNSIEIIQSIKSLHPNLTLVSNTENLAPGGARNHGVRVSRGRYITFIDADDYYHQGALKEALQHIISNDLDILLCDMARHTLNQPNNQPTLKFKHNSIMTGRQFLVKNSLPWACTRYLFKRSLMVDNNLWFVEKCSAQDVDWSHKIAFYAQKMQYSPILLQHYILFDDSLTGYEFKSQKFVNYRLASGFRVYQLLSLYDQPEERDQILKVVRSIFSHAIKYYLILPNSPKDKQDKLKKYIPDDIRLGKDIYFVKNHSFLYSLTTTILAPLFRFSIKMRRKIKGR